MGGWGKHFYLILSIFWFFWKTQARCRKIQKARADSSPDPSSARTKCKNKFSRGFAKSFSPENSFGKTESIVSTTNNKITTEWIPPVSPLEKPARATHCHTENQKGNRAKQNRMHSVLLGRCDTAEAEEHAFQRVLERRLWRGGMEIAHRTLFWK